MKKPVDEEKLNKRAQRVLRGLQSLVIAAIAMVVILVIALLSLYQSGMFAEDAPAWGVILLVVICCVAVAVVAGLFICGVWAAVLSARLRAVREAKAKAEKNSGK